MHLCARNYGCKKILIKKVIYSNECHCGNSYGYFGTAAAHGRYCTTQCAGSTEICGASGTNKILATGYLSKYYLNLIIR